MKKFLQEKSLEKIERPSESRNLNFKISGFSSNIKSRSTSIIVETTEKCQTLFKKVRNLDDEIKNEKENALKVMNKMTMAVGARMNKHFSSHLL